MAEDQDDSQKTEEPSQKKLQDAREKGQVASSKEVSNFLLLGLATLLFAVAMPGIMHDLAIDLTHYIANATDPTAVDSGLGGELRRAVMILAVSLAVPLGASVVVALVAPALQNAIAVSAENLKPKLERISPLAGFKRLFSLKSLVEFLKGLLKITIMTVIGLAVVWPYRQKLVSAGHLDVLASLEFLWGIAIWMIAAVTACLSILAGLDFAYQRFEFMKQMRMSLRDLKDEHKQSEGDPMIKQRLRGLRMEKARQRMMAEVPSSTVVVTNPTHFAVALRYDTSEGAAPKVVAKGVEEVALRIRAVAKEHDVPIVENPPLARALHKAVDLGAMIPPEHYQAVAEVIGYVLKLKQSSPGVPERSP